jgi:hypothetical protein
MSTAEKYHRFAKECVELAGQTPNADVRETMLRMAEEWMELAIAAANERKPETADGH